MLLSTILVPLLPKQRTRYSSIQFKELLFLSASPPAESYYSTHFPLPTKTVTTTFTAPARRLRQVPEPEPTPAPLTRLVGAAWPSLITKRGRIVSTLCSCIEKQPTLTTTVGFLVQKPSVLIPPILYPYIAYPVISTESHDRHSSSGIKTTTTACAYPSSTIVQVAPCSIVTGRDDIVVTYAEFGTKPGGGTPGTVGDGSATARSSPHIGTFVAVGAVDSGIGQLE